MVPVECDVDADVLAPADGVADLRVVVGVLWLELDADTDGKLMTPRRRSAVEDAAHDADQRARLVALYRVAGVRDCVNLLETRCGAGEFVGVFIIDEGDSAADKCGGKGEPWDVVPEVVESGSSAKRVVAPVHAPLSRRLEL